MVVKKEKVQSAPYKIKDTDKNKPKLQKTKHKFLEERKRNFGIGQSIQPKRDLTRCVKWPKYVRIQRQEKILTQRLKAPPAINQFNIKLDKKVTCALFRLLKKYKPETRAQKRLRLLNLAKNEIKTKITDKSTQKRVITKSTDKPYTIKFGLNHITSLIEKKLTALVIIAADVNPIELVIWVPALCRKMNIPFVITKSKAQLGKFVNKKTATAIALTRIRPEHKAKFNLILKGIEDGFTRRIEIARKRWSVPFMGARTRKILAERAKETTVKVKN